MKLKFRLSLMVIAILIAVVAGISILLLSKASKISVRLSKQIMELISSREAEYWKGQIDGHIRMLSTIADVMADYDELDPLDRRDIYNVMLEGTLTSQSELLLIYTIWRPNYIDGMDERMIGKPGSTATGQYAVTFTRENSFIEKRLSSDVNAAMNWINSPNARKTRVETPFARVVQGENLFLLRIMVPVISSRTNEVVGGVGMLISIGSIQPSLEATVKNNDEIAAMAIYDETGFVLAHIYPDRVGKNLKEVDTVYGDDMDEVIKHVNNGEKFSCTNYSEVMKTDLELFLSPFQLTSSDVSWTVMVSAREDHILNEVTNVTQYTIILAIIFIVAIAIAIYIVLNLTLKPVVNVAETLKDIAQGEGDLTVKIAEKGKDEITDLSRYFNQTMEKIRNLIITIKKEAEKLSGVGTELASNMNETAAAVNEITANIQSIKGRVLNQSASVTETNATMEQVVANINKLNGHVENQSDNIASASSAIEQMVANINSVTNTLVNNASNVNTLKEASETGRNGLQEVASDIQEISRESEGLLEINSVMESIASQTNLLSMNAAIEAAHAGEAGKGFAVVADEIRKLAESSSEQSKTIGVVLKKIAESINKIRNSTDNVLARFEAIDSSVKTVSLQEENIRNAMEEQGEGSKQLLRNTGGLNEITQRVKSGSMEMLEGSKEVMSESQNLEKVTQEITAGMNEMASGANQINTAVNLVNEISVKNREGIETLLKEVSRFKIE